MGIYRRNVKIQMVLFIAFIILGINVVLNYFFASTAPWYSFIILGLSVLLIVWAVIVYKNGDPTVIEISKKEYQTIRTTLYAYFIVYVINIVLQSMDAIDGFVLSITASALLSLLGIFGLLIHLQLLNKG